MIPIHTKRKKGSQSEGEYARERVALLMDVSTWSKYRTYRPAPAMKFEDVPSGSSTHGCPLQRGGVRPVEGVPHANVGGVAIELDRETASGDETPPTLPYACLRE